MLTITCHGYYCLIIILPYIFTHYCYMLAIYITLLLAPIILHILLRHYIHPYIIVLPLFFIIITIIITPLLSLLYYYYYYYYMLFIIIFAIIITLHYYYYFSFDIIIAITHYTLLSFSPYY